MNLKHYCKQSYIPSNWMLWIGLVVLALSLSTLNLAAAQSETSSFNEENVAIQSPVDKHRTQSNTSSSKIALRLPFKEGETWRFTGGFEPHHDDRPGHQYIRGGGIDLKAQQLGWNSSIAAAVYPVAKGEVVKSSSCHLTVKSVIDGTTFYTKYVHLKDLAYSTGNKHINDLKKPLGYIETNKVRAQCGGRADGPHLHFEIDESLSGDSSDNYMANNFTFSGYALSYNADRDETRFTKGSQSIAPCAASDAVCGNKGLIKHEAISAPTSCPSNQFHAQYFNNPHREGPATVTRCEGGPISYNWETNAPFSGMNHDLFSVIWNGRFNFSSAGQYTFQAETDDGMVVWVNDTLLIEQWHVQAATTYRKTIDLPAGEHRIKVVYFEAHGGATAKLRWDKTGSSANACPTINAWKGEYWNNKDLRGSRVLCRDDRNIDFNWGNGGPGHGVGNDTFSARWTRTIHFNKSGAYRFHLRGDDGIRLWIDGERIINAWRDQGSTTYSATKHLDAGNHAIKVEYYENGGGANVRLWWENPEQRAQFKGRPHSQAFTDKYNNVHYLVCADNLPGKTVFIRMHRGPSHGYQAREWAYQQRANGRCVTFRDLDGSGQAFRNTDYHIAAGLGDWPSRNWPTGNCYGASDRHGLCDTMRIVANKTLLIARHSQRCLDVAGWSTGNGGKIHQWGCHHGNNQQWILVRTADNAFSIKSRHSGKCLDVANWSRSYGGKIHQWTCHGGNNQKWIPISVGNGYYLFKNKHSNLCIDVAGISTRNGAKIHQWGCHYGGNQQFRFHFRHDKGAKAQDTPNLVDGFELEQAQEVVISNNVFTDSLKVDTTYPINLWHDDASFDVNVMQEVALTTGEQVDAYVNWAKKEPIAQLTAADVPQALTVVTFNQPVPLAEVEALMSANSGTIVQAKAIYLEANSADEAANTWILEADKVIEGNLAQALVEMETAVSTQTPSSTKAPHQLEHQGIVSLTVWLPLESIDALNSEEVVFLADASPSYLRLLVSKADLTKLGTSAGHTATDGFDTAIRPFVDDLYNHIETEASSE